MLNSKTDVTVEQIHIFGYGVEKSYFSPFYSDPWKNLFLRKAYTYKHCGNIFHYFICKYEIMHWGEALHMYQCRKSYTGIVRYMKKFTLTGGHTLYISNVRSLLALKIVIKYMKDDPNIDPFAWHHFPLLPHL